VNPLVLRWLIASRRKSAHQRDQETGAAWVLTEWPSMTGLQASATSFWESEEDVSRDAGQGILVLVLDRGMPMNGFAGGVRDQANSRF
jgi:hypothetical protein